MTPLVAFICQLSLETCGTPRGADLQECKLSAPLMISPFQPPLHDPHKHQCPSRGEQLHRLGGGDYHSHQRKLGLREGRCLSWDTKARMYIDKSVAVSHSQEVTMLHS